MRVTTYYLTVLILATGSNLWVLQGVLGRSGALYPRDSETREVKSLDGIWNFRLSLQNPEFGFKNFWYKSDLNKTGPVEPMPVPSSYNDITQDPEVRDHVGFVWYDRRFFAPAAWKNAKSRVWLRFGSVHYAAQVWVNGDEVMTHEIGHLPFEQEITNNINYGVENRLTVACDNTLRNDTIPQGEVKKIKTDNGTIKLQQTYSFDFFNYAGIDRPVVLYTTPKLYIDDIIVNTNINNTTGIIAYNVSYGGYSGNQKVYCYVNVLDKNNDIVAQSQGLNNSIKIPNANLWWPFLMHPQPGYLYTLEVHIATDSIPNADVYRLKVGIRTVTWSNTQFFINNKPAYLRGFGRHEDSNIRGKGLDLALVTKDYNLIRWIGANTYRTSHYPYSEELYDFADEQGIMIIDECPGVDIDLFFDALLVKHKASLTALIKRDKNRPSVIMWSIANEPRSDLNASDDYFGNVSKHVRDLDSSRAITLSMNGNSSENKVAQHLDIISVNTYNGWYSNTGRLDMITDLVVNETKAWHDKFNKLVLVSEYGADTIAGLHMDPEYVWSEEYQVQLMSRHFKAFDELRGTGFFIGEFIWNFADFMTAQTILRVGGNKKGIFTRERQPKASAHHLRGRYNLLAQELDGVKPPADLFPYITPNRSSWSMFHSEL